MWFRGWIQEEPMLTLGFLLRGCGATPYSIDVGSTGYAGNYDTAALENAAGSIGVVAIVG